MVDFAFTVAQFQLAEPWGKVALGKTDIPRITVEFAAVHHAVGVGNLGSAALVCAGNGGVFGRGDAQLQHLAVAFEVGVNAVAVAVFVVVGFVMGDIGTDVAVFAAELGFQRAVAAVVAACRQGSVNVVRFFSEIRVFADKLHRAADQSHALGNGLRAFGDHDFIKRIGVDIGSRRVHAHTATTINKLVVGIDGEARAAQTAEQRIARAAAFADDAHVGHGL